MLPFLGPLFDFVSAVTVLWVINGAVLEGSVCSFFGFCAGFSAGGTGIFRLPITLDGSSHEASL